MQKARRLMDQNSVSFQNVFNSLVFYYTWFRKPNFRVQTRSEQYLEVCFVFVLFFVRGEHAQKPKFGENFSKKKLHKALRSAQFLVSFTSFYF